jgi:hypothetical protein
VTVSAIYRQYELHWSQWEQALSCWDSDLLTTTADAQGRFVLGNLPAQATVTLDVSAPGFEKVVRCQVPAASDSVHIYLNQPASLSGKVVYQGKPVPGAEVNARDAKPVKTGPDGAFTIEGLGPGQKELAATSKEQGLVGGHPAALLLKAGEHRTGLVVELQRAATITGKCVDAKSGEPFANAEVWERSPTPLGASNSSAVSAADGSYSLQALPGEVELFCQGQWRRPPLYMVHNQEQRFRLEPGQTVKAQDFAIEVQPTIHGQVLLPDGTPAAGVQIGTIAHVDYQVAPADFFALRTDEHGQFALQVLQLSRCGPPYGLIARDQERDLAAMQFVTEAGKPVTIYLQPGAWLLSKVATPNGTPVPGWPVELKLGNTSDGVCHIPGACSDEKGDLRLGPLPPGVDVKVLLGEQLACFQVNKQTLDELPYSLKPGEQRRIEPLVAEPAGRTVRGWVGDAEQHPLAGALVFGDHAACPVTTDAQGRFELSGLPVRGKVRVVAIHPTEPLFAGVNLEPDGSVEPGLVPVPPCSVIMRVKQPDGTPLGTVQSGESGMSGVTTISDELNNRLRRCGWNYYGFNDEQGNLRMDGLIAGLSYQIWVNDRYDKVGYKELGFYVEPGQTVDLGEVKLDAR